MKETSMKITKDLLKKVLRDGCSDKEKEQVLTWSKSKDANAQLEEIFAEHWYDEEVKDFSENLDSNKLLSQIEARLISAENDQGVADRYQIRKPDNSRTFTIIRYAAAVAVMIVASVLIINYPKDDAVEEVAVQNKEIRKFADYGQKLRVKLSDGSLVVLNSNSSVTYPQYFSENHRTIKLVGEAYFEVAKDSLRPFSVVAGATTTTALGTSFNINSYNPDEIGISLATGKVKVSAEGIKGNAVEFLIPGNAVTYLAGSGEFAERDFDYKNDFLWKEGIIYFKDASFDEIKYKLELWYGVQISSELTNESIKPYTGAFDDETLANVLRSMSYSLDFSFNLDGKNVKIMSN